MNASMIFGAKSITSRFPHPVIFGAKPITSQIPFCLISVLFYHGGFIINTSGLTNPEKQLAKRMEGNTPWTCLL